MATMATLRDIAITPNDEILVLMRADTAIELHKLDVDGNPAGGFGTNGVVAFTDPILRSARAMALTRSSRIVIAGSNASIDPFVARLTADGALDPSFGQNGITVRAGSSIEVNKVIELADERLIIVGFASSDGTLIRMWN